MIDVTLYADKNIKHNVKYRNGGLNNSIVIDGVKAVSNGTLANKNIYADNSIEISIPIDICAKANYIGLKIGSTIIAGEITGLDYVNDNNTSVVYSVDHYTTAQMTNSLRNGFFTGAFGLCRRTNLTYPKESIVNQQSEPYGGNDIRVIDTHLSTMFNTQVESYTGIKIASATNLVDMGYRLVLWISSFAVHCIRANGGTVVKWGDTNTPVTPNQVTRVSNFGGDPNTNSEWQHSFSTGFPLVFKTSSELTNFIDAMLSNVGERIHISPYGYESDGVMKRYANMDSQYFYVTQEFTEYTAESMKPVPLTQVKMITDIDILRIQILPERFCNGNVAHLTSYEINTGYGLHNFNPLRDERDTILPDGTIIQDFSKSKLMHYPYWYHEILTRAGNKVTLLPQNEMKITNYLNDTIYKIVLRFVGGNMPKLMVSIKNKEDYDNSSFGKDNESFWYTIYEYPSIPWANNVSSQQQMGELEARMHRLGKQQSAVIGASTKGTGFMYGVRGGKTHAGQGWFRKAMTSIGGSFGGTGQNPYTGEVSTSGNNTNRKRSEQAELDSQTAMDNAGRIVGNEPMVVMGEGSIEMLYSQPLTIYRCGMTDGELYGFARFIERKGQTCHLNINPITNGGDIFSGNASITSYGGKTYYEFFDLDVNGTMPVDFKNAIQMMFCGGCYLIS